jgi:protein TonB
VAAAGTLLFKEPLLRVQDGFAVPLPPGGGGPRSAEPPAPAPAKPETPEAPKAEPPPKVLRPPKEEPRKGLPLPDAKRGRAKPEPAKPSSPGGSPTGTGASSRTPGLELGPPGPGVPGGTDIQGDWYLATVQQKIWMIWIQQIRAGMTQPVTVSFTIEADGSVTDVRVLQSSGAALLDLAAQRAIYSAGPFAPLPKDHGTRYTITATFKPTS